MNRKVWFTFLAAEVLDYWMRNENYFSSSVEEKEKRLPRRYIYIKIVEGKVLRKRPKAGGSHATPRRQNCHGKDIGRVFPADDTVRVCHFDGQQTTWKWAPWKSREHWCLLLTAEFLLGLGFCLTRPYESLFFVNSRPFRWLDLRIPGICRARRTRIFKPRAHGERSTMQTSLN